MATIKLNQTVRCKYYAVASQGYLIKIIGLVRRLIARRPTRLAALRIRLIDMRLFLARLIILKLTLINVFLSTLFLLIYD